MPGPARPSALSWWRPIAGPGELVWPAGPGCGSVRTRVQSRYRRRLADRPLGGRRVLVPLLVRRFFCDSTGRCRRPLSRSTR
ncbi:transposase family protein [Streptomyces goshikiensis]|uniref:transposase family protein n=1 Tax=Streptomyces goshikiensis TaxID=1942 RepID=UPI00371212DB